MIRARDLQVRLGRRDILRGADLDVAPGERVALLGLNGAGKTTLFRCLLGMTGYRGELTVDSHPVHAADPETRRLMAYVPQRPPKFDGTLREMLDLFTALRGMPPQAVEARLDGMALSLEDHGDKLVTNLSGGMIQKVLLALAIAAEPKVLLLDEPTANLDPRARRDVLRSLEDVPAGTTILLSSHRLADVETVARRVLILHRGAFAYDGSVADLARTIGRTAVIRLAIAEDHHRPAVRHLGDLGIPPDAINLNGALEVRIDPGRAADMIHQLRMKGIPVDDIAVHRPTLEAELERLLDTTEVARDAPDRGAKEDSDGS